MVDVQIYYTVGGKIVFGKKNNEARPGAAMTKTLRQAILQVYSRAAKCSFRSPSKINQFGRTKDSKKVAAGTAEPV